MSVHNLSVLQIEPREDFVLTPWIDDVVERGMSYLDAGYPVHLSGPAGIGKSTIALHIAGLRKKPVMLVHGDDEFKSSDLIGGEHGYRSSRVVDNYIHSVLKTEESVRRNWVDNRITQACKYGFTLIYDEFTRSRPEANNVLLSILEEGLLNFSLPRAGESYVQVHPEFRAIFTSNPEEYAGVHKTQDALLDRLITIELSHYDRDTEIAIAQAKSGLSGQEAAKIVDIVRELRQEGFHPSLRSSIMIAKILSNRGGRVESDDPVFLQTCTDVLGAATMKVKKAGKSIVREEVKRLIDKHLT